MARDSITSDAAPLSAWGKIKAGVSGFFKAVGGYLPKGLMLSVLACGVIALLGLATGYAPFAALAEPSMFASRVALSIAIGALVSGGVGVVEGIDAADKNARGNHAQNAACACPPETTPQTQVSFGLTPPRLPQNEKIAKANAR